jgi:hypothetical protein
MPKETETHHICGAPRIAGVRHWDHTEFVAAEKVRKAAAMGVPEEPHAEHLRSIEWREGRRLAVKVEQESVRKQIAKLNRIEHHLYEESEFIAYELQPETLEKRLNALLKKQEETMQRNNEKRLEAQALSFKNALSGTKHPKDSPVKKLILAFGFCQYD